LRWLLWSSVLLAAVFWVTFSWFHRAALIDVERRGSATLQLHAGDLLASVEKFEHLPYLVGAERTLLNLLLTPTDAVLVEQANHYLAFAQGRTEVAAVYLIDLQGNTLAASNWDAPSSFVGKNYRFRPYFRDALKGRTGMFYGVGVTTGEPGVFIAAPISAGARIVGVVAVKIDLTAFENKWRQAGLQMAIADGQGIIFLTTEPAWRYRNLAPLSQATLQHLQETRQYGDFAQISLGRPDAHDADPALRPWSIDDQNYLVLGNHLSRFDWQALLFSNPSEPRRQGLLAGEVAGLILSLLLLALALGWQYRRRQSERQASRRQLAQMVAVLDQRIAERTAELTAANDVAVQTGKLAVLGQMAASISHEISQPLAALRTLADNASAFLAREDTANAGSNLRLIGDLCARMGSIIGELKAFARKEPARMQAVAIQQVMNGSLMLIEPLRHASGTRILAQATEFCVWGDSIRLEQVMVNLLRNGIDAMESQTVRQIDIGFTGTDTEVTITIRDHGPGLSAEALAHLFEPFFTTKPSGKGLGLGLSLSKAIVSEMGGTIRVDNAHPGAEFQLRLARAPQ
jgi:two-component system C4-dicarboxylate transport sensor histidine kinase DctB